MPASLDVYGMNSTKKVFGHFHGKKEEEKTF
jgi:hypothetical protein